MRRNKAVKEKEGKRGENRRGGKREIEGSRKVGREERRSTNCYSSFTQRENIK